jgi:F0F1-type ATP synthase assembly protein I
MIKNLLDEEENNLLEIETKSDDKRISAFTLENLPPIGTKQTVSNVSEISAEPTPENSSTNTDSENEFSFNLIKETPKSVEKPMFQTEFKPESAAETVRKSGLAYAAGITLFASIVFMMGLGWFADLMFGTSPWGIVGGIVLGSIIGFVQFFRITSQILKNKD